jgi:tetratricopeptide (TPR) repeat protein
MPKPGKPNTKKTDRENSDLDLEIGFLSGLLRRDPEYVDALQLLGDDLTKRGRYAEGLDVDQKLAQLQPDNALVQYNLACSYALTKRFEEAHLSLNRALDLGYTDFKWLSRDPDLANFRSHPLYENIQSKVRRLRGSK